jgi:hypothetical protein
LIERAVEPGPGEREAGDTVGGEVDQHFDDASPICSVSAGWIVPGQSVLHGVSIESDFAARIAMVP